jgi:hypothetical protein
MADQRSRGGKKQGGSNPANPEQQQTTHVNQPRPESSKPSDQGRKPMDEPRDDPSEAPESGDKNRTGGT